MSETHDWHETGGHGHYVEGGIFKYGTPIVNYVKCVKCGQLGFRKPGRRVVYTWEQNNGHG